MARGHHREPQSLNRAAFGATWHCLTGCAIGEVLGLVIATALDWGNLASIAIAVALAFRVFGYALTLRPLVRGGIPLRKAARIALAADTVSIAVMEIVDNGFVLIVPERWRRASATSSSGGASPSASSSHSGPPSRSTAP